MKQQLRQFLFGTQIGNERFINIAWLLFRIHTGLSIAIHAGYPKMKAISAPGWFADQVAGLGFTFPSPEFWAAMASWGEFVGGILIAVGLLTRFAAVQLAFQFFIIAFVWYDDPAPLIGMYYQHLFFWCYLLIAVAGGGRYSIDKWIMTKKIVRPILVPQAAIVSIFLLSGFQLPAQQTQVTIDDLRPLAGKWSGKLTYLDYSSNTSESIPAGINVSLKNKNTFEFNFFYSKEPDHNSSEKYVIKKNGTMINDWALIEKKMLNNGVLKIVLENRGVDGNENKSATIQQILLISKNSFIITKMVKYDGDPDYFRRNEYSFLRDESAGEDRSGTVLQRFFI